MSSPATPAPNPTKIFNTMNAYHASEALGAATELDIFTAIAEGATTPSVLAAKRSISERGARILCDFLTVHEFLTKENGSYALTSDSAFFLDSRKPSFLGKATRFLLHEGQRHSFRHIAEAVKTGCGVGEGLEP